MIEIRGKSNTAICYTNVLEETARQQIQDMCDQPLFAGARIRIMPDVHAGKGCTIGTTMTISDKAFPSLVGVDIGCGMETVKLAEKEIDFAKLDQVIRTKIPSGKRIRSTPHPLVKQIDLKALRCFSSISMDRVPLSLGTLGGGNHFIEVDRDETGDLYLVVHSGSRHLGVLTASYYQKLGWETMLKAQQKQIDSYMADRGVPELENVSPEQSDIPAKFAYVEGQNLEDYIHDMRIVQQYADLNRQAMTQTILEEMELTEIERFTTIHNYIDIECMILRKGSVSAQKGEKLLIPINMRDGAIICVGKGNMEWNYSAPHGAGRILSRLEAQNTLTVEEFQMQMQGIYTTCVAKNTLDESPMAYKGLDEILSQVLPSVDIVKRIKPIYNYKAGT